jgi:lysophospholipase L1-like esterase
MVSYIGSKAAPANGYGSQWVFLGDSITEGDRASSYPYWVSWLSKQQIRVVKNAGKGGDQTSGMLVRIITDVLPYSPQVCFVMGGTNDYSPVGTGSITMQSALLRYKQNIDAICQTLMANRIKPVLGTVPPNNTVGTRLIFINEQNTWLRRYAQSKGILLVDMYAAVVDPATGKYIASPSVYTTDGTHPTQAASAVMAQAIVSAATPFIPPSLDAGFPNLADTSTLTPNLGFANLNGTSGMPNNWAPYGGTAAITAGTMAPTSLTDAQIPGKTLKIQYTTAQTNGPSATTSKVLAGDLIQISGIMSCDANMYPQVQVGVVGGAISKPLIIPTGNAHPALDHVRWYAEVNADITGNFGVSLLTSSTASGGNVWWGCPTIRNLSSVGGI